MVDNFNFTPGTGAVGAADDIAGVLYPRIKVSWGVDGAAVDASYTNPIPVTPIMTSGGNVSIATNSTGTTYNAFASQACRQLTIVNETGTKIEARQGGTGVAIPIRDGNSFTFLGIANTNEISLRRTDVSNTTVTVQARWEA